MTARRGRGRVIAVLGACAIALAGCAPGDGGSATDWAQPGSAADASAAVGALPVQQVSGVVSRTEGDLAPPTNRWYSGLAFGDATQRVFPFPLALEANPEAFTVSLPRVVAGATTIEAADAAGVAVGVPADQTTVIRADPVSVTVRYTRGGDPVGDLTTAEGWPVVAFTAAEDLSLSVAARLQDEGADVWTTEIDGQAFGVRAPEATVTADSVELPAGATAQWFAIPADSTASAWAEALGGAVTSVSTSYAAGDDAVSTRLVYEGTDKTVLVPFPGHETGDSCDLGTFATAFGEATACAATSLEWQVPRIEPRDEYDFDPLDDATRKSLAAQVEKDLEATEPIPADTYFGGKGLARIAALLSLARALGADDLAERIADRLESELEPWLEPEGCVDREERCFVYDDALHLVVGLTPSFGSEAGNDHHFHYGYFLTAAAALTEARPDSVGRLAPVMDALAADIAAGTADGALPSQRVFDSYRGHSWASGPSPFASGNNQESSSEAVAAWNGLALWAGARGDERLAHTAEWMLSAEADAARALWLEPDLTGIPAGFDRGMISLNWSSKRDYATWFSAEPSAILGIQVMPVGPISLQTLPADPDRVARNVAEAGGDSAFSGALGEYVLAYSALAGESGLAHAQEVAEHLDADALDDGTSLSALLAWLAALDLTRKSAP